MLKVNEIFGPTIQGEGKSAGKACMFLRLALCNLHCIWCDTPYTWNWLGTKFAHPHKFDREKEIHKMTAEEVWQVLQKKSASTDAIVISGGEPLLQQEALMPFLHLCRRHGYWIEIETNGTIVPTAPLFNLVNQVNCSPKLSNSLVEKELREKKAALRSLAENAKTCFKFVVCAQQDSWEIVELVRQYELKREQVWLMPEGRTAEELYLHEGIVRSLCKTYGFSFSQRLHVTQLGGKRGV